MMLLIRALRVERPLGERHSDDHNLAPK